MLRARPTPRSFVPRAACAGAHACRATSRSRTATRCWRRSPTATSRISGYSPGADCAATLACLSVLGVDHSARRARGLRNRRTRCARPVRAVPPARLREFRDDHAADERRPRGAPAPRHADRRCLADTTPDAPRHRSAHADGRPNRIRRRAAPAHDTRRRPARDRATSPKCPARRSRAPCCSPACSRRDEPRVQEPRANPRSHRTRTDRFRGARRCRRTDRRRRGGPASDRTGSHGAGRCVGAAFWIALAAATPGARVEIEGVGLNPTRIGSLDIVRRAGAACPSTSRPSRQASRPA